jgi:hypothetical protein
MLFIVVVSFIGGVTQETTNLQQGIVNFYHMILFRVHIAMNRIRAYNFSGDRY